MAKWGGLPSIVSALPNDLRNFLQRVKETLDNSMSGDSRFVTVGELVNGNVATLDSYGNVVTANVDQLFDFTPPPAPTGLTATGALTTIMLQWNDPLYANLSHAEVWRSGTDNLGAAVLTGTTRGVMYADSVDTQSSYYYWVRFVSKADVTGPYQGISGVHGVTSADPSDMLTILTGQLGASQLNTTLGSRINLIDSTGTGLMDRVSALNLLTEPLTGQVYAAATGVLDALTRVDALHQDVMYERNISNATISVDPISGKINLLATANVTTDIEARLTSAEVAINSNTSSITSTVATVTTHGSEITVAQGQIATLENQITSKVSQAYVDTALSDQVSGNPTVAALASAMLDTLLHTDEIRDANRKKTHSIATAEQSISSNADALSAEASARLLLSSSFDSMAASLTNNYYTKASADAAVASQTSAMSVAAFRQRIYRQPLPPSTLLGLGIGDAWIDTDNNNAISYWDGASWIISEDLRIAANTAAILTEQTVRASEVNGLQAQYTVKVDVGGYVTGFGLASTLKDGVPTSEFVIRADNFSIAPVNTDNAAADGSPFFYRTTSTVINGVTIPAGAYMKSAYIHDASITNAKIANLAVDNAKIANLSADKLTAGSVAVGEYIQSTGYVAGSAGWRVHGDGSAEFANIYARGNIRATSFSAITLNANEHIKQGQTAYNTGTGFFLGDNGAGVPVFSLGGGSAGTKGLTWDGSVLALKGDITGSNGSFAGDISAATGTFTGGIDVKSAASGARMEMKNNVIKVYDANNVLRVQLGDLTA